MMLFDETEAAPRVIRPYLSSDCWEGSNWKRVLDTLDVLSRFVQSTQPEVGAILASRWGVKAGSGTIKRHWALLKCERQLFILDALEYIGNSSLGVIRLTEDAKMILQSFDIQPVETDWERLIRLHRGLEWRKHTALCLGAAKEARRRYQNIWVLPEPTGVLEPDLCVGEDGGLLYNVEVERGDEDEKDDKWRNYGAAKALLAIVAATPIRRRAMVSRAAIFVSHGVAADLSTLSQQPEPGEDEGWDYEAFWLQRW